MRFAEVTLTSDIMAAVLTGWPDLKLPRFDEAQRLYGGEESGAFRLGEVVVRIGPRWRTIEDAEWCHALARCAQRRTACALAPLKDREERTTVRSGGRPVSVWPFVEGRWGDREDDRQVTEAAAVLANLHRALAACDPGSPPPRRSPMAPVHRVEDVALDRWLSEFALRHANAHPLHGDYYPGNVLVRDGRIVAVLDWDEAFIAPPEVELAWAACEWGDVLRRGDLSRARGFVADYGEAGGTAEELDDEALAQLYRNRLRLDLSYIGASGLRGVEDDEDDEDDGGYRDRQVEVFELLRP